MENLKPENQELREKILKGYSNTMPMYDKQLTEDEVMALMAFVRSGAIPSLPSSSNAQAVPGREAQVNGKVGLNSNVLEYSAETANSTPTSRDKNLAVGAMAAEKGDQNR